MKPLLHNLFYNTLYIIILPSYYPDMKPPFTSANCTTQFIHLWHSKEREPHFPIVLRAGQSCINGNWFSTLHTQNFVSFCSVLNNNLRPHSIQFLYIWTTIFPINRSEYLLKIYKTPKYLPSFGSQILPLTSLNHENYTHSFSTFKKSWLEQEEMSRGSTASASLN
jgi:hypothetical protein